MGLWAWGALALATLGIIGTGQGEPTAVSPSPESIYCTSPACLTALLADQI